MKTLKDRIIRMFIMGFRQLQDPYYQGFAAQISFYLMLSIVPIFILIAQLLGVFNISVETAIEVFHEYTGRQVKGMMSSLFRFSSLGFGNVVYFIIAFWAGSRASFALTRIANYTLTEGDSTGRNYFIERVRAIKTLLITIITVVFSIVILCYGKLILTGIVSVFSLDAEKYADSAWLWIRWPLGFFLFFVMISYDLYILPTKKRPYRTVIPGSLFAALGMLVVTGAYSFYTSSLANYDIVYGALSSVVALLIWFFLLAWVLCLGVLFNKVWVDTTEPFSKRNPPEHLARLKAKEDAPGDEPSGEKGSGSDASDGDALTGASPGDGKSISASGKTVSGDAFSGKNAPSGEHAADDHGAEVSKFDIDPDEFGLDVIKEILIGEHDEKASESGTMAEPVADAIIPKPVQDKLHIGRPKYARQQELKEKLKEEREREKARKNKQGNE